MILLIVVLFEESDENNGVEPRSGLTFDVSNDWTFGIYQDGSASDGFHMFIDELPGQSNVPVPIPAGADALITLAQPKKLQDLMHCYKKDKALKLAYFDHYDPQGIQCKFEKASDIMFDLIGNCRLPGLSYFPKDMCSFDQMVLIYAGVANPDVFSKLTGKFVSVQKAKERSDAIVS